MYKDILSSLWWIVIFLLKTIIMVIGIFWVPICLIGTNIPRKPLKWEYIPLNFLGWPYQNLRDGCLGDSRLKYWNVLYPQWIDKLPFPHYIKAYYWMVFRNPFNRNRYIRGLGCDIRECNIKLLAGDEYVSDVYDQYGWQYVKADDKVFNYYGFYLYKPAFKYKGNQFYMRVRLGHKIEPRYAEQAFLDEDDGRASKAWKGTTFGISIRGERK